MPDTASVLDGLSSGAVDTRVSVRAQPGARRTVALFATTLFVSAFLMFLVEPMVARMLLPLLGGAPAVWNTCLVFFQAMLLGGYAYAHSATAWLGLRRHLVLHSVLLLLPLAVLPVGLQYATLPLPGQSPIGWLLMALLVAVGLPFFVLSTSAAVLQKWFSVTDGDTARDPYFLYAASNLGSFIALLAYPIVVEPTLRLQDQSRLWSAGYWILVALTVGCAVTVWRRSGSALPSARVAATDAPLLSWSRRGRWLALAFVPSSLLLAVTNYIATDVASVPLLWVLPLSLYLLAFVVAFSPSLDRVSALNRRLMPMFAVMLTLVLTAGMINPLWLVIPLHLVVFLTIAIVCHSELAADRPPPTRLTEFYFWIACGGMLGGLFNALVAPLVFTGIAEYPIVLVAACLLRSASPSTNEPKISLGDVAVPLVVGVLAAVSILVNNHFGSFSRFIIVGAAGPALIAFSQQRHRVRFAASLAVILIAGTLSQSQFGRAVYATRTFFGVYRVLLDNAHGYRFIIHGTTLHGMQSLDPRRSHDPVSYFHRSGPIGQMFASVPQATQTSNVAVVGLGVGTLATYRTPSQHWTFYEIDPAVERIARTAEYFTYLRDCGEQCAVVTGDGRLSLGSAAPHSYGLIVLDAFSSDAVPMHLMTKEALALYLSKLAPGGVVAFNISNMHLSFKSVLARIAADAGLVALWQQEPPDAGSWESGKLPSEWFVVARDRADFGNLAEDARWKVPIAASATPLWTDDFSNILSVLRRKGSS
jgi:spermidine synthase